MVATTKVFEPSTTSSSYDPGDSSSDIDEIDNRPIETIIIYANDVPSSQLVNKFIMNYESERIKSYKDRWPLDFISPEKLAAIGFYYLGPFDKVKCYFCEIEIGLWEEFDDPAAEHLKWSPNCPLMTKQDNNNIPITKTPPRGKINSVHFNLDGPETDVKIVYDQKNKNTKDGTATCKLEPTGQEIKIRPKINHSDDSDESDQFDPLEMLRAPSSHRLPHHEPKPEGTSEPPATEPAASEPCTPKDCNAGPSKSALRRPKKNENEATFPDYATEANRLKSYKDWPKGKSQKPQDMCDAGFFFTGEDDLVKCFNCGAGLKDWSPQDDPWEQHALRHGSCQYLKLIKGRDFIEEVNIKHAKKCSALPVPGSGGATYVNYKSGIPKAMRSFVTNPGPIMKNQMGGGKKQSRKDSKNKLCKICYENNYDTVFFPCGHIVACNKCANAVKSCPMCREPISNRTRYYFA